MRALALLSVVSIGAAVLGEGATRLSTPERGPCRAGGGAASGRGGSCALHCAISSRLCRLCCLASSAGGGGGGGGGADDKNPADGEDGRRPEPPRERTTRAPETGSTMEEGGQPALVFPDKLPEGTQDAMLETAAHILSIVSGEDSTRIRIWIESPERNTDNLDRLAYKLASFPRAPFGRSYWRLVLRASKNRPFTLLREALAVRAAYLEAGGVLTPAASTAAEEEPEATTESSEWWRRLA